MKRCNDKSWDDEMSWWDNESRNDSRNESFRKRLINQMIWSSDLLAEFHLITSSFDSLCMNDSTSNRICLFETIRIVDSSSICWFRIESIYNHSIEMISFRSTDFRNRRKINEFENEYAILMKSNRNDNERQRWLD
jgi:hypothetical protein